MITITEKNIKQSFKYLYRWIVWAVFFKERTGKSHSNQFVISLKNLFRIWNEFNSFLYSSEKNYFI
jgi:hypothetical protein